MLWLNLILEFSGLSESEIRRRLTLEEEQDALVSTIVDPDDNFTETKYLLYGLDLEDQRYGTFVVVESTELTLCLGANYVLHLHQELLTYHLHQSSNFEPLTAVVS